MAGLTTPSVDDDEPPGPGQFAKTIPRDYHEPTNPHFGGLGNVPPAGDFPPAYRVLPG